MSAKLKCLKCIAATPLSALSARVVPTYRPTAFVTGDASWKTYFEFLSPDRLSLQANSNRRICEALTERGTS